MFDFLRRMLLPVMVVLLIAFLGWLVLDVGLDISGRRGTLSQAFAGSVNGETISWETYNRVYQNLYQQETQRGDQEVSDARIKELEQSAWQQLVHQTLLFQEAAKHNIVVTDEEVFAYLRSAPPQFLQEYQAFQTDGRFDQQKYAAAMANPQYAPLWAQVEPGVRSDLQQWKMQEAVIQAVEVGDAEAKQAFVDHFEKIKIGLVYFPYEKFTMRIQTPTEDELRQYYNEHQSEFKAGERATVNVAVISKEPTEEDWLRVQTRIQAIRDSIQAGADFATMAQTYSQDGSARNGGDVGWFESGRMVPEFDRRCFSMKEGELSEPFRTEFGWHIIKHFGYRDEPIKGADGKPTGAVQKQAHVAYIILKVEPSQETIDAAFRKLQDVATAAKQKDFAAAAQEYGLTTNKTTPFQRTGNVPFIGADKTACDFAFDNPVGTVSGVMENVTGIYVIQVAEHIPAGIGTYEEMRGQVALDLRNKQLAALCHASAQSLYNAARAGGNLETAAKAQGAEYFQSDFFSRDMYVPRIGRDPMAISGAFKLTSVGQISEPIDYAQGCAVMTLLQRLPVDLSQFDQKRDSIVTAVRQSKQQEFYSRWVQSLVKNAKIETNVGRAASDQ